jgi:hypothetical protein
MNVWNIGKKGRDNIPLFIEKIKCRNVGEYRKKPDRREGCEGAIRRGSQGPKISSAV